MEKIKAINEVTDIQVGYSTYDGFEVVTTKQTIQLLISNGQCCCESFGYFWSNDDLTQFIGASIRSVSHTDTALNTTKMEDIYLDQGDTMFITFDTSRGQLQFVAYNEHNGYYGHEAKIISTQLTESYEL